MGKIVNKRLRSYVRTTEQRMQKTGKKKMTGQGKIGKKAAKLLLSTGTAPTRKANAPTPRQPAKAKTKAKSAESRSLTKRLRGCVQHQLYPEDKTLLLIGEGDFSFTRALVELRGHGGGIVSTSLDTLEQVHKKYPGSPERLAALAQQGVVVLHGVDGANLSECEAIAGSGASIDNIVFNFPHLGCGVKDKARNVRMHQKLLRAFFESAKNFIDEETGEIHVAVKKGEPYDSWKLVNMAKDAGLVLKTTLPFDASMFPGYAHCKTAGIREMSGDNSIINKYGARVWVLKHPIADDVPTKVPGKDIPFPDYGDYDSDGDLIVKKD
ncbi:25S rRNA (uridine-N(3))-methyltransferase [Diplonema papillatum]|nr:25S rRNA (uridine-N(3))-methyltransferase [Diplonema papillatum]